MRTIDFAPLFRSTVGFDHLANMLDAASRNDQAGYPPYNIELIKEDSYCVSMAVAGFKAEDIEITAEQNTLSVTGHKKADNDEKKTYLHRGIATRNFERQFQLAEHVKVTDARIEDGLLFIDLVREIPEAMKPRKISINTPEMKTLIDEKSSVAA